MREFLTIRETAELLGVDYRTIYRRVISGELPALRIGGVYRIRREDLNRLIQRESGGSALAAEEKCGACMRRITPANPAVGRCEGEGCTAAICAKCWPRRRCCAVHRRSTTAAATRGVAGEPGGGAQVDARRDEEGSQSAPDASIATERGETAGAAHGLPAIASVGPQSHAVPPGPVMAANARALELAFLDRFQSNVAAARTLPHPFDGKGHSARRVKAERTIFDSGDEISSLLLVRRGRKTVPKALPRNTRMRYHLTFGRGLRGRPRQPRVVLVVEARFVCRLERYVDRGSDDEALGISELISLHEEYAALAETLDCRLVAGLGSPTGWSPEAVAAVTGRGQTYSLHNQAVALMLVDLRTGLLSYSQHHLLAQRYAVFFQPFVPEQRMEEIKRHVASELVHRDSLSLSQVALELGFPTYEIVEAFRALGTMDEYEVHDLDSIGLVISRSR